MNRREFCLTMAALGAAVKAKCSGLVTGAGPAQAHAASPSFPAIEATPLGCATDKAVVLYKDWQMREEAICGDHGSLFSQPGFSEAPSWYPTTVPTTTQGTLVRQGIYPDPYVSLNNMQIPDACPEQNERYGLNKYSHLPNHENPWSKPYWFRTEFALPADFKGKIVWLHLDGINYRADVWVNGKQVGDHEKVAGMFERYRFNVTDAIHRQGANAIAVRIHPLDFPGDPIDEQIGGIMGGYGPNGGDAEILRNVTQYCSIGWDWIAACRDRNVGIWQHIWLEGTGEVAVRDPAGFATLNAANDIAKLKIRFHCESAAAKPVRADARIRIQPDGFEGKTIELRKRIDVTPGAPQEFIFDAADHPELVMQNPQLWWPVGYGEHPLYILNVEVWVGGVMASSAKSNLGVRTVGTLVLPSGGRAFTVNGRIFRLSGGAWVPDFLMSWGAQRYRDEARLMAAGNHTCVRVNGCGIIPPEVFFDECDRQGLLVWQDLSRTSVETHYAKSYHQEEPNVWGTVACDDAALLLRNTEDCVLRLRSHPSLLLYEGCNEAAPQRNFGEVVQNEMLPRLDGTRPWLPCSSSNPGWEKEPIHMSSGGPYALIRLPEYFRLYATEKQFTCKNEIGLTSPPPINSLAGPMPLWTSNEYSSPVSDKELSYHDGTDHYYRATPEIIHADLGFASSVAEYLLMTDLYTNSAYRAIYEAANKARPRNAGTHLWKTNAAWPSMVQQVYDWYMCCNGGFYGMKAALKPLHVQTSIDDCGVQVVSTLATEQKGMRVTAKVVSIDGKLEATKEWTTDVPADATKHLDTLPAVAGDGRLHFIGLTLRDKDGAEVDHQVTWMQRDCKWHELLHIEPTRLALSVKSQSHDANETTYHLLVENKSAIPAVNAALSILAGERGTEVLPCFWSDNSTTFLPGESKEFTVTFRTGLLNGKEPHLIAEGWNLLPTEISLADGKPVEFGVHIVKIAKDYLNGQAAVRVVAESSDQRPEAARIVSWPLVLHLNGQPVRTFRLAVHGQGQADALVPVAWNTSDDIFTAELSSMA